MSKEKKGRIPPELLSEYFRELGKKGGKIGGAVTASQLTPAQRKRKASDAGKAASANLTPAERKARASAAAKARWSKKRSKKTDK
jgi:hypothetical protein